MDLDIRYYKDKLWLNEEDESGFIAITTFWTQKENVVKMITDKSKIAIVGNLYTYEGMEFICRNLLANPKIKYLVFTGNDRNCLTKKIIERQNFIGEFSEFENEFWRRYYDKILFIELKGLNSMLEMLKDDGMCNHEKIVMPKPVKTEISTFDSEKSGFVVRDCDLYRLWQKALMKIKLFGVETNGTKEIMNLVSVLNKEPKITTAMPAHEIINDYLKQVVDEVPTDGMSYTYGSRIHGRKQIKHIVKALKKDILSRQCVATTWIPEEDYDHPPPCLVLVVFRIRKIENDEHYTHEMFMNTVMRSHDVMKAYCMNVYAFWKLGEKVISLVEHDDIKIKMSKLTNLSISAHVYADDFKRLNEVNELGCCLDERGYFIITTNEKDKTIEVKLLNRDNKVLNVWISDDPHELSDNIQSFISEVSHALYMGRELMRAKSCLTEGIKYVQD